MCRRLKVFAVSLFAATLFCLPVSADFTVSDSSNLGRVTTAIESLLNQFLKVEGVTSMIRDIRNNLSVSLTGSFAQQLLSAIRSLHDDSNFPDFMGYQVLFYLDGRYFSTCWVGSSVYPNSDGYFNIPDANYSGIGFDGGLNTYHTLALDRGTYYFTLSVRADNPINTDDFIITFGQKNFNAYDVSWHTDFADTSRYYVSGYFDVDEHIVSRDIAFGFKPWVRSGIVNGGVALVSSESAATGAINPSQDELVSSVDKSGIQQQQQEDQLWTNVNNYKTDLTFNLDSWSDAANGLTYVTGVFMVIWDNSPTQIIILSLMLGIAMLAIGRGVMAAVRVSNRNNRRNSQDSG